MQEHVVVDLLKLFLKVEIWLSVGWLILVMAKQLARVGSLWPRHDERASIEESTLQEKALRLIMLATPDNLFVAVGVFISGIVIQLVGTELLHWYGREEIREFINQHRKTIAVTVRGQPLGDPKFIDALASTRFVFAHHSHAVERIPVQIVANTGQTISLMLAKDSSDPHEYWVFFQPYGMSAGDPIGATYTFLLK